jgi:hypothetical protein
MSMPFHYIVNSHYFTYIKENAQIWAPYAADVFPFQCYNRICIKDPAFVPLEGNTEVARQIPSIRWLKMVAFRHRIANEILDALESHGHNLPRDTDRVIQKIWFTMSFPGTGSRIGLLHNRKYWADHELFIATMFFIKIDMFLNDPVDGAGEHELREAFLGQKHLVPLCKMLQGKLNFIEVLQYWIMYDYRPAPEHRGMSVFGVPAQHVGCLQLEGFGLGVSRALRIDEGVMAESVRRKLVFQRRYMDCVFWGYSPATNNIPRHLIRGRLNTSTETD